MVYYKPSSSTGTNIFDPVDSSIDEKKALNGPSAPGDVSKFLVEQGLA
jgi:hypothetical protein